MLNRAMPDAGRRPLANAANFAPSGWKAATPRPVRKTNTSTSPYTWVSAASAVPAPARPTPAGSSQMAPRRSETSPNSGCTREEAIVAHSITAAVNAYESPKRSRRKGSMAGTAPEAKSTARCPPESATIALLSTPARTVPAYADRPVEARARRRRPPGERTEGARVRSGAARGPRPRPRARPDPAHRARVRRRARRAGGGGARPRGALPLRDRRRAGRAGADGPAGARGVRRRRRRHPLLRDRGRGARPGRLVRRDHGGGAHLAGHDADPALRHGGATARVAARPRLR